MPWRRTSDWWLTMMDPQNLLILMSDEHNPKVMGCAGNDDHPYAQSGRVGARGDALHLGLHDLSDLRTGPRLVRGGQVCSPDRLLGQRRRLRRRHSELASPAARPGPRGRVDRQAALPRCAGRRSRLHDRDRPDARDRRHRRREGPGARKHPQAAWRRQDGQARRPGRIALHRLRPRDRRARADLAA